MTRVRSQLHRRITVLKMKNKAFTYLRRNSKTFARSKSHVYRSDSVRMLSLLFQPRHSKPALQLSTSLSSAWRLTAGPTCHGRLWGKQAKRRLMASDIYTSRSQTAGSHINTITAHYLISHVTKNSLYSS